jgi:DNA polymerase (family 10)
VDNKAIAGILYETADLMEIDGADSFRIRSYRNAAEAIEAQHQQISDLIADPKQVLAISGIGKGMLVNLTEMLKSGQLPSMSNY